MDLEFVHSFGGNVKGNRNVTFYNDTTVGFIAGKLCVLYDLETFSQRLINIIDGKEISTITRCFNHLALAIKGKPASICLYNLESETKKLYNGPKSMVSDSFSCISISQSLRFVAGSGSEPDWLVVLWLSLTRQIITTFSPTTSKPDSFISDISFHAGGREEVVVVGKQILRVYEYQDEDNTGEINFSEIIIEKFENEEYTSITWTQKENLAVGTVSGKILFFRGIEMVKEISVVHSLAPESEQLSTSSNSVTCLAVSPTELFCVFGENVVTFKGEEIAEYDFYRMLLLPKNEDISVLPGILPSKRGTVNHLEVSSNNRTVVLSTDLGELAYFNCSEVNGNYFKLLLPAQHVEPILSLSCARGRSLIATCSKNIFILWNYESKNQEAYLKFKDEILSMALHPTGLYVAIGFKYYARVCTIVCNGLKDKKTLKVESCSKISFSNGGQYLVLANDFCMSVYRFVTFSLLAKLAGHAGLVTDIVWKENDMKVVSCDTRGVICEWDAVSWDKIWANTAILSYSSLTVTPNNQFIITICKEKGIKCLRDAMVLWESSSSKELTVIASDHMGEVLYCGTIDGNIGKLISPDFKALDEVYAHNGRTIDIEFSSDLTYLFSVGTDGLLMCWKGPNKNSSPAKCTFSGVNFLSSSDFEDQKKKLKLINMSIQENEIGYECELKLNQLKYEESMKNMFLRHELILKELNQMIFVMKSDKKQSLLFDSDLTQPLKNIEDELRNKVFNYTVELDATFKKTDECVLDHSEKVADYQDRVRALEESYANTWSDDTDKEEAILLEIKEAERILLEEKRSTRNKKQNFEDDKKRLDAKAKAKVDREHAEQIATLKREQDKVEKMKRETRKLTNMLTFVQEDNQRKRDEISLQIEKNIQEKTKCVLVVEEELKTKEHEFKRKEKLLQNVEAEFFTSKKDVEKQRRFHSVSKSAVDQVKSSIATAEDEVQARKKKITNMTVSFTKLEADIKIAQDQCSVINDKLKDSVEDLHQKQDLIRSNQSILTKYKNLLHESLSPTCDAEKVKLDILHVLAQYKSRTDESLDSNLKAEFEHQIKKLQDTYEGIKKQPMKTMKNLATADFRLSQENSKLLKEVHELQRDVGQLRDVIFKMETSMGLPFIRKARPTKEMKELRDKIELVISSTKKDRTKSAEEMANLDKLIEEQQNELIRLKNLISEEKKRVK
ncbi:cilia- and flagella-associated protein 57-like [Parasteatoda tepidariorum]|uniref:cilia- and flagella-associated protein 57-like n=1 Tax=Parasteatoda tepidariorum TaxID=114398 RepID=UPI001C72584D|nr:cilia- and flagella-associated protein 57-like [Parasteatoda tepidariorum]